MSDAVITLAGREFVLPPFTLRQVRSIAAAISRTPGRDPSEVEALDQMVATVAAALEEDHPSMTAAAILGLETNVAELAAANRIILVHAGYIAPAAPAAEGQAHG